MERLEICMAYLQAMIKVSRVYRLEHIIGQIVGRLLKDHRDELISLRPIEIPGDAGPYREPT